MGRWGGVHDWTSRYPLRKWDSTAKRVSRTSQWGVGVEFKSWISTYVLPKRDSTAKHVSEASQWGDGRLGSQGSQDLTDDCETKSNARDTSAKHPIGAMGKGGVW